MEYHILEEPEPSYEDDIIDNIIPNTQYFVISLYFFHHNLEYPQSSPLTTFRPTLTRFM